MIHFAWRHTAVSRITFFLIMKNSLPNRATGNFKGKFIKVFNYGTIKSNLTVNLSRLLLGILENHSFQAIHCF
jgi:hypothetical protein